MFRVSTARVEGGERTGRDGGRGEVSIIILDHTKVFLSEIQDFSFKVGRRPTIPT